MDVKEWLGEDNILGCDIFEKKYRKNQETTDEFLDRVSNGDSELRKVMKEQKFLYAGRTLSNRGIDDLISSMMNCYSRGFIKDTTADILQANTDIGLTFKSQGGQGISLSQIRPIDCGINHGSYASDGIVPWMELYNRTTESVSQGGSRKGALIMTLDIWHKEADTFITIKSDPDKIQKANLSLEIDDKFMEIVRKDMELRKQGIQEDTVVHIKKNYEGNVIEYDVVPIKLYELMMQEAYDWGEPGCIFTNRFRNYNLMEYCADYQIETCNPCGEQPLPKHGACNLGSINLGAFVKNAFRPNAYIDLEDLKYVVGIAVRALDRIIDENQDNHALPEQKEMSLKYRNIGLGVMGFWDMLCKLNLRYGSRASIEQADKLFNIIFRQAVYASSQLAKEKGAFPAYTPQVLKSRIIQKHFSQQELDTLEISKYGLRNCSLLSIAPTGSIANMLGVSGGIEPAFQLSYKRKTESLNNGEAFYDVEVGVVNEYKEIMKTDRCPDFVTALNIPWRERVDMQATIQEHIDTGISSTVNLPENISLEEMKELYLYAWKKGVKGITIFRNKCKRSGVLIDKTSKDSNKDSVKQDIPRGVIIKADDNCIGKKRTLVTGCGTLHCEAFFDPDTGALLETYFSKGSTGGCNQFMIGLSRMISLAARGGVDISAIIDQLESSGTCPSYAVRRATKHDTSTGSSCPVAIGKALKSMYEEMRKDLQCDEDDGGDATDEPASEAHNVKEDSTHLSVDRTDLCPECGSPLVFEGGCNTCKNCGYSKCD